MMAAFSLIGVSFTEEQIFHVSSTRHEITWLIWLEGTDTPR